MADSWLTISRDVRTELIERRSRFIASAIRVESRPDVDRWLDSLRQEFPDATHHCYAYRLAPNGADYRFADDGEPAGTAGKPILFAIQHADLVDVLVVVTRYYGGTKLGAGGLARAYEEAARNVLDVAGTAERHLRVPIRIMTTYDDMAATRRLLEEYAEDLEEEFGEIVRFHAVVRQDQVERLETELQEATSGRAGLLVESNDGLS